MKIAREWYLGVAVAGLAAALAMAPAHLSAQVAIDADDIGGVVTGPSGPEAGVWVIAETTDLGTKMAKMVVTDDQGRYVIPDLPQATTAMVLGLVALVGSLFTCGLTLVVAPFAWISGAGARRTLRASPEIGRAHV